MLLCENKLRLEISHDGNFCHFFSEGTPLAETAGGDYFRLHIDDGYHREVMIRSSVQTGKVVKDGDITRIKFKKLLTEDGRTLNIVFTVFIEESEDGFVFSSCVENGDDVRVNEVQLPFIDLACVCDENRENDVLCRPRGLGERMRDPWRRLEAAHTEYMASDYNEIFAPMTYPRPASMAWFGVESAEHFLYIGREDERCHVCSLVSGIQPRTAKEPRLISAVAHYPCAKKGETVATAPVRVMLCEGDFRMGTEIYGAWARNAFFTPREKPEWVKKMSGWQRVILRHQFGEIFWKYSDLPRLYREGREFGLDTLIVFGWWKGRFDNGYPIYEVDAELGGEEALKAAVAEIQSEGGHVILYTNGVLIDRATDYYRYAGNKICRIDIDGNEYQEHYQFANNGTLLRNFGYKTFVAACQATDEWRERLVKNGRQKLSYGADSIFFDQIGGHKCWPCFNEKHKHGARVDDDPYYRRENLKALAALCDGEHALGSENTVDCFSCVVDYNHGCDYGNWFRRSAGDTASARLCPAMFRRTFPEVIMTNRFIHDCRAGWRDELNYAFVLGLRFDVSIYRGRVVGVAGLPEYASMIKKLTAMREKYGEFFYDGRFVDAFEGLPDGVMGFAYANGDKRLAALWNRTDAEITVSIGNVEIKIPASDVVCKEV